MNKLPVFFFLGLGTWGLGLGSLTFAQQNNFKTYSIEDGLPQSSVYAIFQDSRGYLWLGTEGGGISRFDGINFKTFSKKEGLAGNFARSFIEDSRGYLWIGTDEGISVYDGVKFTTIDTGKGLSINIVIRLYEDAQGNIWAGTANGGLNKIRFFNSDSVVIITYTAEDGLSSNFIFDIYEDSNLNLWLGTFNGGINILTFSEEKIHIDNLQRGINIPGTQILVIEEDLDGNLWFGTYDAGAFKIITSGPDSGMVINYNETNGLNDNTIWDILCDRNGNIWFATNDGGINILSGNNVKSYTEQQGLPGNQILSVFEDHQGNIWIGTMGNGLCRFMGDHFAHYTEKEGLSNSQIYNIVQDKEENYWLASGDGLIRLCLSKSDSSRHKGTPLCTNFTTKEGLASNSVKSLSVASDGTLWIATIAGISKLTMGALPSKALAKVGSPSFTNYSTEEGLADNTVNCIFVDSKDIVWCGTRGGVSAWHGDGFFNITEEGGLINNEVQTIIEDRQGNIWLGTLNGLARYDMNTLNNYDETDGLLNKKIHALAEDQYGNIWLGTFGGGLYKFNVNSQNNMPVRLIADDAVLSSNNIYSLLFQDKNILVVGTDKGFDKLFFDDAQKIITVRNYNASDGFTGVENNLNAVYKDKKGCLWFGTVKGVTRYDPAVEKINNEPPKTHITDLKLSFKNINWQSRAGMAIPWFNLPGQLTLPYSSNHLTFEFVGISFSNPEKVLYKYQLEGLEGDWSPPRKETEVIYPGLPYGKYTFKVIAKNENGIWGTEPVTFDFIINPPFWHTWWFYLLCALLGISGIMAFIKVRERNLKREKVALEVKVKERTIELATKNKEITDSINYACHIQQAILPSLSAIERIFPESFVLFLPKAIVSGDFYWFHRVDASPSNKRGSGCVFLAACDCTGHGVPGAFVSMIGNNLLNQIIIEKNIDKPGKILSMLNNGVKSAFTREGEQGAQDGMDMALVSLKPQVPPFGGTWDLQFAGANNPLILIQNGELSVIRGDKASIGGNTETNYDFTSHTIELKKGDTVYFLSDGYQDQFGGPQGKKFTRKQFRELLLSIQDNNMAEQKESIFKTFNDWKGTEEQVDDILVIGVRI